MPKKNIIEEYAYLSDIDAKFWEVSERKRFGSCH